MHEQEVRSNNVILRMRFSQPRPPTYMKGKDKLAYMEERAWVANDFIEYAGREGTYAYKGEDESPLVAPMQGTYLEYVSRQGAFSDKGEKTQKDGTGVWGKNGVLVGAELERVKKLFQTTEGNIWHGLISPTKEMGEKFFADKESAMEFTQACFTRFLSSTHLNYNNVEWYCGWHDDSASGIKHIQFAFCEKQPHVNAKGKQSYTQKGVIRKSALADALINFEEYFSGKRNDVHLARDTLMQKIKDVKLQDVQEDVAVKVYELAQKLPKVSGRGGYRHPEYAPYRKEIDGIVDELLRRVPTLNKSYVTLQSKVAEREERFKDVSKGFEKMKPSDKVAELRQDIRERLGNSIIALSKRFRREITANEFAELRERRLSLMMATQEESRLRKKKQAQAKREQKRFRRIFGEWWKQTTSPNYMEQFYKDLEKFKRASEQDVDENEKDENQ